MILILLLKLIMTKLSPQEHKNRLRQDLFYWMNNRAKLPSGKQYSFKGHEYMERIAKHHWVPGDQVFIMKSSQCGASEYAIHWMVWMQERNLPDWQGIFRGADSPGADVRVDPRGPSLRWRWF